jgi:hypothetical protein
MHKRLIKNHLIRRRLKCSLTNNKSVKVRGHEPRKEDCRIVCVKP